MTAAAAAKSLQSCPALCDPIDRSPSGSTIPGILQARTLEWVAIDLRDRLSFFFFFFGIDKMFPALNKTFTESLLCSRHVRSSGEKMSKRGQGPWQRPN